MSDWQSEYHKSLSDGTGLGIGGILGDQEKQRRKWASDAAEQRRADRVARKNQAATTISESKFAAETALEYQSLGAFEPFA